MCCELENYVEEAAVTCLGYCPDIHLEVLRTFMKVGMPIVSPRFDQCISKIKSTPLPLLVTYYFSIILQVITTK